MLGGRLVKGVACYFCKMEHANDDSNTTTPADTATSTQAFESQTPAVACNAGALASGPLVASTALLKEDDPRILKGQQFHQVGHL